jgi:CheY-like chemotaxis protein
VLIVDDERHIAEMIQSLLDRYGYSAAIAESGEEALQLLERGDFDVVITDHFLDRGELCGLDLVQAVEKTGRAIPFLVATACVDDEILDSLREHPLVRELFRKPFDLMALLKRVADVVQQRRPAGRNEDADVKTSSSSGLDG